MHTDELFYLLNREYLFPNYKPTESDLKMMDIMTTLWTNFAATGLIMFFISLQLNY